jgi:non-specific serine/threonine protein kinase
LGLGEKAEAGFRLASALWLFWFIRNHFIEGRQWYDEALSLSGNASPLIRIRLLNGATSNAMGRGDFEQTAVLSEQGLALARDHADQWGIVMALHHLGIAAMMQGAYKQAQIHLEEGLILARKTENWGIARYLLADLASLAVAKNDYERASAFYEEDLALARKVGDQWGSCYALGNLAYIKYKKGDFVQAEVLSQQSLSLTREFGDRRYISYLLGQLGVVALGQDKPERAMQLLTAAEVLANSVGIVFDPDEQADHESAVARIRAQLDSDKFEALQAEGRALTLEQAITFALGEGDDS